VTAKGREGGLYGSWPQTLGEDWGGGLKQGRRISGKSTGMNNSTMLLHCCRPRMVGLGAEQVVQLQKGLDVLLQWSM
jgi:hypothetical protein